MVDGVRWWLWQKLVSLIEFSASLLLSSLLSTILNGTRWMVAHVLLMCVLCVL